MTNAISKLHSALETWSFKYNCYEAVHPWTPFCSDSALDVGLTVFGEAIKLYTPLYLFSQFVRRRYDFGSFLNTAKSILRSTTFISANAFFALLFFCSSKYFTGKFYYYAVAYIPGFLASSLAVMIEKPNRRASLAFYVANVASETLFRIYVARGYIRPINNGQVYLFTISIATIVMLAHKRGFEDDPLSSAIKLIVGPEEAKQDNKRSLKASSPDKSSEVCAKIQVNKLTVNKIINNLFTGLPSLESSYPENDTGLRAKLFRIIGLIKYFFTARHQLCPHKEECSCFYYVTKASLRALAIGYSSQFGLKLFTKALPVFLKHKQEPVLIGPILTKLISEISRDKSLWRAAFFLSTFSCLYKATNCTLRWSLDSSKPINCFISGLVAGPSLFFYPSPTIALYVVWKSLEALFNEGVKTGSIKNKNLYIVILYGLATAQLFYSALMDPRYMKKSYMSFLDRMSNHRLHMVNRSVLDVFGTEASSGYEDFFPDLHPKFMSRAFLGSIWIWMIEQKFSAKRLMAS